MKYEPLKLTISSSPHDHSSNATQVIMRDVCIALLPALIGGIVFFGFRALALTLISAGACVFFEWLYRNIMNALAARAGLTMFMPMPPNSCLTSTMAKKSPMITAQ